MTDCRSISASFSLFIGSISLEQLQFDCNYLLLGEWKRKVKNIIQYNLVKKIRGKIREPIKGLISAAKTKPKKRKCINPSAPIY